jgi:hypothetical protein
VALYELTKTAITPLGQTTFATQGFAERVDLQRLLRERIEAIAPDTLVIAEEFCEWDESKRRIDLLGVDKDANLVVIELKRSEDGGHMELQAIRYAAMVSAMSFSKAVEVYARYLGHNNVKDAEIALRSFLEDTSADTFGSEVRIVLVSAEFSKEVTTSVLWLNQHDIDIRCVRLRPYALDNRVLLDVQQVIPLPETAEFTIKTREKAEENRRLLGTEADFSKYNLTVDGITLASLTKRSLVLEAVKAALAHGLPPEQIASLVPESKWISVDGELTADKFRDEVSKLQAKLGGKYDLRRYFCEDGELFRIAGRTYALSNQWSLQTISLVDELIARLPAGSLSYFKTPDVV